ncbi:hypothetical protein ANTRET_LOCUS3282 [Anthophora retusa]
MSYDRLGIGCVPWGPHKRMPGQVYERRFSDTGREETINFGEMQRINIISLQEAFQRRRWSIALHGRTAGGTFDSQLLYVIDVD